MTSRWEEVQICHVGLRAAPLHCCSWSPGQTLKTFICFHLEIKPLHNVAGTAVARRHSSAVGYIEAGRWRNARCCLDSSSWKPHKWLMHPRSLHPPVCCRCCVSSCGFTGLCKPWIEHSFRVSLSEFAPRGSPWTKWQQTSPMSRLRQAYLTQVKVPLTCKS